MHESFQLGNWEITRLTSVQELRSVSQEVSRETCFITWTAVFLASRLELNFFYDIKLLYPIIIFCLCGHSDMYLCFTHTLSCQNIGQMLLFALHEE